MTALPIGACDGHVHVFQPDRFAYGEGRNYTPGPADCVALMDHMTTLGLMRCVVVQASGRYREGR
jgi:predicted TIM-barrel fold metal-dependent hydrolase